MHRQIETANRCYDLIRRKVIPLDWSTLGIIFGALAAIFAVCRGIGYFLSLIVKTIIQPTTDNIRGLQSASQTLEDTCAELKRIIDYLRDEQRQLDRRLTIVEQSAKSAHHRLDTMEKRVGER